MYVRRLPFVFGMNLFAGNARSDATRWGVLASCTVNPAAASRSSLSLTRCPSVSQPLIATQTEMHAMAQRGDHLNDMDSDGDRSTSAFEGGRGCMAMCVSIA